MAWHTNALLGALGDEVTVFGEDPECGWFKTRLVKGGPFVPARIWLHQEIDAETGELVDDERWICEVNGEIADIDRYWSFLSKNPITEAEFNYLTASMKWTAEHAPFEPRANPRTAVNWLDVPTPSLLKDMR